MNKQAGMVAWAVWADEHGYGQDAYSMTNDDLYELASTTIAYMDKEEMSYEEYEITADMVAWIRK